MVSTITENEELAGTQFTPFNDTKQPAVDKALSLFISTEQGYDTSQIDRFRQGVSLRLPKQVYASSQPKIWAGNLKHTTRVVTLGQARSFVQFDNSITFTEKPEFNPVWFIQDDEYPLPIIFNNGPQQEEEAIIEPFTIPMRKNTNEGPFYPRSIKGSLEDGNNFSNLDGGSNVVEQFIEYNPPLDPYFFLDEGQAYIGAGDYSNLLDDSFDPLVLYLLKGGDYSDELGRGQTLEESGGDVTVVPGPFPNTKDDPSAAGFADITDEHLQTPTVDPAMNPVQLREGLGETMTMQCFFYVESGINGNRDIMSYGSNYRMSLNFNVSPTRVNYVDIVGTVTFIPSSSWVNFDGWNHIAIRRGFNFKGTPTKSVDAFVNGEFIGIETGLGVPASTADQQFSIGFAVSTFNDFFGRISCVKISGFLSDEEIFSEYNRLNNPIYKTDGSILVEGYTPIIERNIDPFDDTRDEKIVERIRTTDQTFIGELKKLDFDLSEDIRGTFTKKSAASYSDVYGPDAAIYGTDSIAFRGTYKGA